MSPEVMELLSPLFDARATYLAAAFEQVVQTWGSTDRYLEEGLKLSPARRERLRERLLD
jgi:protein-tyrosine phosphatase